MQFNVKIINSENIKEEIEKIGFDLRYISEGVKKHEFLNIKISDIKPHISTIIKETALSKGCDAAVHKGVLLRTTESSDLILSGSLKQIEEVAFSLQKQQFNLNILSDEILSLIGNKKCYCPKIMGILNVTEDSFSDGGKFIDPKKAIAHGKKLINEGADIIDIGAESTAPNRKEIPFETEIERLLPVIRELKKENIPISIDTRHHKTAEIMIKEGADIINDVSGMNFDPKMLEVIKNFDVKICIVHSKGNPDNMDALDTYNDLKKEVFNFLQSKIILLNENGISNDRIITDVGFGFAKNIDQNFELMKSVKEFNSLKTETLAGVSRKRFIKSISNDDIDDVTMLASFYFMQNNVDIIRVHNVSKTIEAKNLYEKLYLSAK